MSELKEIVKLLEKLHGLGGYDVHLNREGDLLTVFRDGNTLFAISSEDLPADWRLVSRWVYHTWLAEKLKSQLIK